MRESVVVQIAKELKRLPVSTTANGISLANVVRRCLQADPASRYSASKANEMISYLKNHNGW